MTNQNDGGLLGRITALALILAVAYGVRGIASGKMGCPVMSATGGCCMTGAHHDEAAAPAAPDAADLDAHKNIPAPAPAPAPAKK
ncbi:MAG: hypothetical protein HY079_05205 [Elusimicrobia bacterium]|nr:hypothetical protein [Elusimicrobiota bacterium]